MSTSAVVADWERPLSELERYAGWLGKDHVSTAVRANVQALGEAIHVGTETTLLLTTLAKDIARLPSGDLRKMLQTAVRQLRVLLEPAPIDERERDGS